MPPSPLQGKANAADVQPGVPYQFMRVGYFTADLDSTPDALVFNRTVGLKDSYKPQN